MREPETVLFESPVVLDEDAVMQDAASIKINLMEREVCNRCHHWHRKAILTIGTMFRMRKKPCPCCLEDINPSKKITEEDDE